MIDSYLTTETIHRTPGAPGLRSTDWTERTIKTRWTPKTQTVSNEAGQEVVSDTAIQSKAKVKPGDTLRDSDGKDWPVVAVAEFNNLEGQVLFYEAYL